MPDNGQNTPVPGINTIYGNLGQNPESLPHGTYSVAEGFEQDILLRATEFGADYGIARWTHGPDGEWGFFVGLPYNGAFWRRDQITDPDVLALLDAQVNEVLTNGYAAYREGAPEDGITNDMLYTTRITEWAPWMRPGPEITESMFMRNSDGERVETPWGSYSMQWWTPDYYNSVSTFIQSRAPMVDGLNLATMIPSQNPAPSFYLDDAAQFEQMVGTYVTAESVTRYNDEVRRRFGDDSEHLLTGDYANMDAFVAHLLENRENIEPDSPEWLFLNSVIPDPMVENRAMLESFLDTHPITQDDIAFYNAWAAEQQPAFPALTSTDPDFLRTQLLSSEVNIPRGSSLDGFIEYKQIVSSAQFATALIADARAINPELDIAAHAGLVATLPENHPAREAFFANLTAGNNDTVITVENFYDVARDVNGRPLEPTQVVTDTNVALFGDPVQPIANELAAAGVPMVSFVTEDIGNHPAVMDELLRDGVVPVITAPDLEDIRPEFGDIIAQFALLQEQDPRHVAYYNDPTLVQIDGQEFTLGQLRAGRAVELMPNQFEPLDVTVPGYDASLNYANLMASAEYIEASHAYALTAPRPDVLEVLNAQTQEMGVYNQGAIYDKVLLAIDEGMSRDQLDQLLRSNLYDPSVILDAVYDRDGNIAYNAIESLPALYDTRFDYYGQEFDNLADDMSVRQMIEANPIRPDWQPAMLASSEVVAAMQANEANLPENIVQMFADGVIEQDEIAGLGAALGADASQILDFNQAVAQAAGTNRKIDDEVELQDAIAAAQQLLEATGNNTQQPQQATTVQADQNRISEEPGSRSNDNGIAA
jgi:hypothetical protein